jgi:hypothetical protein
METVTDKQVINRLVQSEAGQKAKQAILRDMTAERMNLKAQAETLRKERGKQLRELNDAAAVAQQHLEAARKTLTAAELEHRQAAQAQGQTRAHYDARITKLERQLLETAPAVIDDFIGWLADQEHDCRETEITERAQKTDPPKINTHTDEAVREYWNDGASLQERMAAIRNARAEADGLKGLILDADDIQQRLDALRESLPAVEMRLAYER